MPTVLQGLTFTEHATDIKREPHNVVPQSRADIPLIGEFNSEFGLIHRLEFPQNRSDNPHYGE